MIERLRRWLFGEPVDDLPTLSEREAVQNTRIGDDLTESLILSISPMGERHLEDGRHNGSDGSGRT